MSAGNMSNDQVQQSQRCGRYSRVSQKNQKKILVKLVFVDGKITHEAAEIACIIEDLHEALSTRTNEKVK
ncbi:unnamed protein product [Heligmosomoides polygyrus]|uniref:FERM domain-containing protein n=1 Tax=Heligmosomoides polygyrus TaxID=6339 RepID=A0A183FXG8_HELPZ|nr:unnamed protein product [Heligmosomoides polygyrus]